MNALLSPRSLMLLAAIGTVLFASVTFPRGADAARNLEIALQDDTVFLGQRYIDRQRAFRLARALGVTRLRVNANWAYSMPLPLAKARRKPPQQPEAQGGRRQVRDGHGGDGQLGADPHRQHGRQQAADAH